MGELGWAGGTQLAPQLGAILDTLEPNQQASSTHNNSLRWGFLMPDTRVSVAVV